MFMINLLFNLTNIIILFTISIYLQLEFYNSILDEILKLTKENKRDEFIDFIKKAFDPFLNKVTDSKINIKNIRLMFYITFILILTLQILVLTFTIHEIYLWIPITITIIFVIFHIILINIGKILNL